MRVYNLSDGVGGKQNVNYFSISLFLPSYFPGTRSLSANALSSNAAATSVPGIALPWSKTIVQNESCHGDVHLHLGSETARRKNNKRESRQQHLENREIVCELKWF